MPLRTVVRVRGARAGVSEAVCEMVLSRMQLRTAGLPARGCWQGQGSGCGDQPLGKRSKHGPS